MGHKESYHHMSTPDNCPSSLRYYKVLGEVQFSDVATDEPDGHSRCCHNPVRPKPNVFLAIRDGFIQSPFGINIFHLISLAVATVAAESCTYVHFKSDIRYKYSSDYARHSLIKYPITKSHVCNVQYI